MQVPLNTEFNLDVSLPPDSQHIQCKHSSTGLFSWGEHGPGSGDSYTLQTKRHRL